MNGLEVFLRSNLDKKSDGLIEPEQLRFGLRAYGIDINQDEINQLMKMFDTQRTGKINLSDLLSAINKTSN